jgi:hypothetical protein
MGLATINYENHSYSIEYADDFIYNADAGPLVETCKQSLASRHIGAP